MTTKWAIYGPQTNQLSERIFTHNLGNSPICTVFIMQQGYHCEDERTLMLTFIVGSVICSIILPTERIHVSRLPGLALTLQLTTAGRRLTPSALVVDS